MCPPPAAQQVRTPRHAHAVLVVERLLLQGLPPAFPRHGACSLCPLPPPPHPTPPAPAEDEGVVLVVAIQADGTSCMVVLDGGSLQELARARMPWRLTTGFHGAWIPAAA